VPPVCRTDFWKEFPKSFEVYTDISEISVNTAIAIVSFSSSAFNKDFVTENKSGTSFE